MPTKTLYTFEISARVSGMSAAVMGSVEIDTNSIAVAGPLGKTRYTPDVLRKFNLHRDHTQHVQWAVKLISSRDVTVPEEPETKQEAASVNTASNPGETHGEAVSGGQGSGDGSGTGSAAGEGEKQEEIGDEAGEENEGDDSGDGDDADAGSDDRDGADEPSGGSTSDADGGTGRENAGVPHKGKTKKRRR
jgi:hypothetical protein